MRAVFIILLMVVVLLSACGAKNGPRPPKPQPPPQTSHLNPGIPVECLASRGRLDSILDRPYNAPERGGEFLYLYSLV
jgi:hypothetical protein